MNRDAGPLSRPKAVERLLKDRGEVTVEASPEECAALAADFGVPAIRGLVGRFRLSGSLARLHVAGSVEATVTQTCTVSLDPFEAPVREEVDVDFSDGDVVADALAGAEAETLDLPDPIVNGRIDFGVLAAEFLALGLDPYPRKPGIAFETVTVGDDETPFGKLRALRPGDA